MVKNPVPASAGFAIKIWLWPDLEKVNPAQPYLHFTLYTGYDDLLALSEAVNDCQQRISI